MVSDIIIRVKCEPYLIRFFETLYGQSPIKFPKNSNFNTYLDVFLDKTPLDFKIPEYGDHTLEILLPTFERKDIRTFNYLSPKRQEIFTKELWKFFKITFRSEISKSVLMGLDRKDAIELFIEKFNLSQDCWDFMEKDFQRYLKMRLMRKSRRLNKISAV